MAKRIIAVGIGACAYTVVEPHTYTIKMFPLFQSILVIQGDMSGNHTIVGRSGGSGRPLWPCKPIVVFLFACTRKYHLCDQ